MEQIVPKEVQKRLNGWFITFWIFTLCHYVFGIGGVLSSVIVTASDDNSTQKIAGTISALCMAVIGFLQPNEKYRKFVIAWRLLDEKVNQYKHNLIKIEDLLAGMVAAEKTLDQIEQDTSGKRDNKD